MPKLSARFVPVRVWGAGALTVLLGASLAGAAQNPPLGELARKEAERRKAQPSAGKVYTNKDLPPSAQVPRPAAADESQTPGPASAGPSAYPETTPAERAGAQAADGEVKDEAWWKGRIQSAREEVRRNEMFAEALQSRINALSREFVNRDNPVQRARIGEERAGALNELARVKDDIARGVKQIADIEEEARKAGVPPGWLR